MNRNDEFLDLMNELKDTPPELENTVRRAQARARRRRIPVRVLIAAACVAAALAVGAVAIEMTAGLQVSPIRSGSELYPNGLPDDLDGDVEDYSGYSVRGQTDFNWDNISQDLRDAVAEAAAEAETQAYSYHAFFDSKDELEKFLGFSLPENPFLSAGRESTAGYRFDSEEEREEIVHAFASLSVVGEQETGPIQLRITASYVVPDPNHVKHEIWYDEDGEVHYEGERPVGATYRVCIDGVHVHMSIYGAAVSNTYEYKDKILTRKTYVTPSGAEVVIVQKFSEKYGSAGYIAYFVLDGMTIELWASGNTCVDVEGILYSILDAYDTSR